MCEYVFVVCVSEFVLCVCVWVVCVCVCVWVCVCVCVCERERGQVLATFPLFERIPLSDRASMVGLLLATIDCLG